MKKWFRWIIKRYTQLKLDKKIALLYTALILIVSVTLTISITHTAGDIILRDRKDLVQQNVNVAKESVETELNTILNTGLGIVVSNAVQNFYTSSATSISDMENIRMLIQMAMDGNSKIELITLFDDSDKSDFYSKSSTARHKATEEIKEHYENAAETDYYNTRIYYSDTISTSRSNSLTIYFPVYSTERLNQKYGTLAISFRFEMPHISAQKDELNYKLNLIDEKGSYFIADTDIIGKPATFLSNMEKDSNTYVCDNIMYIVSPLEKWNLSMSGQVNIDDVNRTYAHLIITAVIIVAILLALALYIGQQLFGALYAPMYDLLNAMDQIDSNNLNYRLPIAPNAGADQIKLREVFNNMMSRLQEALETIQNKQTIIEKLKFEALQSQIQPHFLYNTLESIHWQALATGNKELSTMVKAMANFYRIVLSNGEDIIPLQKELEHVENYITIQNLRYDNIIEYDIEIPDNLRKYKLPKITLQPLIENAIYHGIRVKEGCHGHIKIFGRQAEERVEIIVANDGVNPSDEVIERIKALLLSQDISEGYGINNVNKRLQIEFGSSYGLHYEISDSEEKNLLAIITLPPIKD